jgi:hypothetical protein
MGTMFVLALFMAEVTAVPLDAKPADEPHNNTAQLARQWPMLLPK